MAKQRTKAIGIDLGTTNSVVAVMDGGIPIVVPNGESENLTPSVVALLEDASVLVGKAAKRQAVLNPQRTIFSGKRFIGRWMAEVEDEARRVPFSIAATTNSAARFDLGAGELAAPEEISAMILRQLVRDASDYLGYQVTDAVITVPAYFNDAQRQATKNAAEIAGVNVLRIINEPTAAALAYGVDQRENKKVLVFDLGGGTLDVSILEIQENMCEVRSTSGDTHLGGDDFDRCITDWLIDDFNREHQIDLRQDPQAWQRISEAAERAKCDLSTATETSVDLPYISNGAAGPKHLTKVITRAKFEALCEELVKRCALPVERSLKDAHLTATDINDVLLVGGSTRIPLVRKMVKELMGGMEPNTSVSPDEVVALGAAVQAAIIKGELDDMVLLDVTPFSLGVLVENNTMQVMIERNSTIPTRETKLFSTAENFQHGVDIVVLQGEHREAALNTELGRFSLDGIQTSLKGEADIEICFDIDESGILQVSAKDLDTGITQNIIIQNTSNLGREEVEGMAKNAAKNAEADDIKRKELQSRQEVQYAIHRGERMLSELAETVSRDVESIKSSCEKLLNDLRNATNREMPLKKLLKLKGSLDEALDELANTQRPQA